MKLLTRNRRQKARLDRGAALSGHPIRLPVARKETREDGKLCITISFERPRWQRRLGGTERALRTFALDTFGQEVYAACDGNVDVMGLSRKLADAHSVGLAEAEMSVAAFLKTLIAKGLIAMEIDKRAAIPAQREPR